MSYNESRDSFCRVVTSRLVLYLDYCELTFGLDACQGSGGPCYYTYPTCKDPANYTRGVKAYSFCMAEGPLAPDCLPCLTAIKTVPGEIVPRDAMTRRARITVELADDAPLALANPDKGESKSNPETAGTFLRNLIARNQNALGRPAEIWQGFYGLPLDDHRLVFRGVIDSVEWKEGGARIVLKDQLVLLDKKIPAKQSSSNVLAAAYNGGSVLSVVDGSEFEAPGTVKIEDEYVTFTGVTDDTLTGCSPGAFGATPASHSAGVSARQTAVFAEPEDGEGLPPDEIFFELLCTHGGLDPLLIEARDRGAGLAQGISESADQVPVDSIEWFAETGIVRIGDELIRYRGMVGSSLQAVERGAYKTSPAPHDQGDPVLISCFSEELGRWMSGTRFRRFIEQAVSVKDLVNDLREQCLVHIWQAEDSFIAAKSVAPPFYTETMKELDDETGFINNSTSWDPGADNITTRVVVHYDPIKPDPGKKNEDYAGVLVVVDAEAESPDYFGEVREKEVFGAWIYREHEAILMASRHLIRYRRGAACFKFAVELKDDDLAVGDFVRITSRDLVGPDGEPLPRALYEVTKKQKTSDNRIEFTAIDTQLSRRYPVISPADVSEDYDQADDEDKNRYGWIGNGDNLVGAGSEDGYHIY